MSKGDDYVEIVDLVSVLYHGIDARDFDLVRSCFLENVVLDIDEWADGTPPIEGREAVLGAMTQGLAAFDMTQHLIGSPRVQIDGDKARSSFYVFGQHLVTGHPGGETCLAGGVLEDELVRTVQGWKIGRHQVRIRWTSGNRVLIGGEPEDA